MCTYAYSRSFGLRHFQENVNDRIAGWIKLNHCIPVSDAFKTSTRSCDKQSTANFICRTTRHYGSESSKIVGIDTVVNLAVGHFLFDVRSDGASARSLT
mmetsp:Transcript_6406/g.11749  ORF Transcript_6406/g.11749 Transcript_6406/m.11749 type:complete len:99 (+) Transcript_6406:1381-1677(+)